MHAGGDEALQMGDVGFSVKAPVIIERNDDGRDDTGEVCDRCIRHGGKTPLKIMKVQIKLENRMRKLG